MVAQFHRKETVQLFALSMDHTTVPLITSKKFDPNIWQFTAKNFAKEGLKYKINLQQIVRDLKYCKSRSSVWWAPILSMYEIFLIFFQPQEWRLKDSSHDQIPQCFKSCTSDNDCDRRDECDAGTCRRKNCRRSIDFATLHAATFHENDAAIIECHRGYIVKIDQVN